MAIYRKIIELQSKQEDEMIDVTSILNRVVLESEIQDGFVLLFVPHTTAAITINENADRDVKTDMLLGLSNTFQKDQSYRHFEGNSHAHIKSSAIGVSEYILVQNNELLLGTWQGVYFMEFDGPRRRNLIIQVQGEKNGN